MYTLYTLDSLYTLDRTYSVDSLYTLERMYSLDSLYTHWRDCTQWTVLHIGHNVHTRQSIHMHRIYTHDSLYTLDNL